MNKNHSKIKYFDLYGLRKEKGEFLESHDIKNTKWQELELKEPNFWFAPKDTRGEKMYDKFISVKDIFKKYNAGIATGKDDVLVDFDKQALIRKLAVYNKDVFEMAMRSYGVSEELIGAWYDELKNKDIENQIKVYSYRPFDNRFTIYNSKILQRARKDIMDNFLSDNVGICITKQLSTNYFNHSLVTNTFTDRCYISLQTREVGYIFPLFIYPTDTKEQNNIFGEEIPQININSNFINLLEKNYNKKYIKDGLFALDVFHYIYAVLYSNTYRKKYNEFLKINFPKIPFTKKTELFYKVAELGKKLVDLHLLKSEKLNKLSVKFPISTANILTDGKVEKREYNSEAKRVYINESQYFEEVEPEIWNYYIGGYQVLDKWLKDRIGKTLSSEDVNHYLKVITALKYTIELQKEIDKLYPEIEKNLI